jgi:hypothetical protein
VTLARTTLTRRSGISLGCGCPWGKRYRSEAAAENARNEDDSHEVIECPRNRQDTARPPAWHLKTTVTRPSLTRTKPLGAQSPRRRRENRERAAMADRRWPDRRDGGVLCAVWEAMQPQWCDRLASDLNEILPRGRSGSITDEANTIPVCRPCNEELTKSPAWAYRFGFLKHDGLCCEGVTVCRRYAEDGAA